MCFTQGYNMRAVFLYTHSLSWTVTSQYQYSGYHLQMINQYALSPLKHYISHNQIMHGGKIQGWITWYLIYFLAQEIHPNLAEVWLIKAYWYHKAPKSMVNYGLCNGLLLIWHQAITRTNADLLLTKCLVINSIQFAAISVQILSWQIIWNSTMKYTSSTWYQIGVMIDFTNGCVLSINHTAPFIANCDMASHLGSWDLWTIDTDVL